MIKPALYIAISLLSLIMPVSAQQNLVVNGDFEEYSSCPQTESYPTQSIKEIEKCIGWKTPTFGTADYFNSCTSNPGVSVPNNYDGSQNAYNGSGYLGAFFTTYTGGGGSDGYSGIMWWEYMQGKLISPLEQGKIYKLSMEVSLAELSDLMITEMGGYFSSDPISSPNTAALTVTPQCVFYEPNYFRDTINWVHVETWFMANGGEQYLTIGNFRNNTTTDTLRRYDWEPLNPNLFVTYFYIDHVTLTESISDLPVGNAFTPNGDGINDLWYLPFSGGQGANKVTIMNRWGNLIYEDDLNSFTWNGKTQNGIECSDGTYFYRISNTNIAGFIQLMK